MVGGVNTNMTLAKEAIRSLLCLGTDSHASLDHLEGLQETGVHM